MDIDLDLYRHEVRVSTNPLVHGTASLVRLSAIDITPDHPRGRLFLSTDSGAKQNRDITNCTSVTNT
jgi:hypothetical protein